MTADRVHQLTGQLIVAGFPGLDVPDEFRELIASGRIGGAILFKRNISSVEQTAELIHLLRSIPAPAPLWLSVDQEGGRVQRLGPPFPQLPPMRRLGGGRGAEGSALAREVGRVLGESLRLVGFDQDYAPVLDVDTNPGNPVIGDRSLSRDPHEVASLGSALVEGFEAARVASCGKHFPGHGDTSRDSHHELPRLEHDLARLRAVELVPFRAAIAAGVPAIMTAHVVFAPLDPQHPATVSEHVIGPILRRELGFGGVVVSDDLEMRAVADHYGIEDAVVRAVRAGCDQLLICSRMDWARAAHGALVKAVERGVLSEERLEEAAGRVRALKAKYALGAAAAPADLAARLPSAAAAALLARLA